MDEGGQVESMPLGRIASFYYLHYVTVAIFHTNLKPSSSLQALLHIVCHGRLNHDNPI